MAASSSSSSAAAEKKYDVFINFKGEDTRHGFISHLYDALCRSSIKAFIDSELNKGDEISSSLFQAIQNSYGSLVVFSENYASSRWCLNELLKILECRNQGHFVIPIFYNINPSHVRKQTGSYGKALATHDRDSNNNEAVLQKWKAAMTEAANIVGWDSQSRNDRNESELILNIVQDVSHKLDHIYKPSKLGLVGIDKRCEHIEALLQEFSIVGIWGMGGIGKTTLARAVFDKLSSQYDSCCFFENIRDELQRRGVNQLRGELFSELLKDDIISINLHKAEGLKYATRRLSNKKVFIVLDDVNNFEQLEHLGHECKSLGPKSKVIITTRDKHLLTCLTSKHETYEVKRLDVKESLELFKSKAFNEHFPEKGYEEMIEKIVSYTQGTPLALKILGLFLHSKTRKEWESAWKRLKKFPNKDIEKVLRLSFDGLNDIDQQIFLDIACFFKGNDKEEVIHLLDNFGFDGGAIGIRTLQDRALITISYGNIVQMHDLIQEMGWQIVREESIREPGRRSRLWDPEEVYDVLKYNKGTHKVEGIILDMSQIKDLHLSASTFKKMINLRYLNFYFGNFEESSKIHVPVNTQLLSDKLRYLHWDKCPLQSLSSKFCAEKLVELNLPNSNVKKLWTGMQDLKNLKSLNLSGSKQLKKLPNFSKASSLKLVRLSGCTNLRRIHPSILSSDTLKALYVNRCKKLESLQSEVHLKSLEYLNFKDCSSLREFSLSSQKLEELSITGTAVEIIHSSIGLCENLEYLTLSDSLKNISSDLSKLTSLKSLEISGCTELDTQNLHIILGSLLSLREIRLTGCLNLSQLPNNIKCLPRLTFLAIRNCDRLPYISELPISIEIVWLINCTSLETIMIPKPLEYKPCCYFLANCMKLDKHSLSSLVELTYFRIKQAATLCEDVSTYSDDACNDNEIFFPGSKVPSWFKYRATQNWISIEIPPHSHLLGFAFYCILSPEFLPYRGKYMEKCRCDCHLEKLQSTISKSNSFYCYFGYEFCPELISDHICIWYDQSDCNELFDEMEKQKAKGHITRKLSFEFYVEVLKEMDESYVVREIVRIDNAIKECGVWPIYASEYDISINDLELREGIKLGYRIDDIDEQVELQFDELRPSTSTTGFTSSIFDLQSQDICSQSARQDLSEINSLCLLNRFNELNYSASHMELNLESGFDDKSNRFWNIDDHQQIGPLQRKKLKTCQDIGELLGRASTSGIGVGCSEFAMQPFIQTNTMNEFVSQPPPTDIFMQNTWLDPSQMNFTYFLDRSSEFDNNLTQLSRNGFCPDFKEMTACGNSLDIDQQGPSLSLWLNGGHPQMNPYDISVNSSLYTSLSSSGLPDIVQMTQANNVLGTSSFWLNQGHLQMNAFDIKANSGLYALSSSLGLPNSVQMAQANNVIGSSSFWFNQGYPQTNPFDIEANSGLLASSSSSGLPNIVQMGQANNVFGSSSFLLNQGYPQMNPFAIGANSGLCTSYSSGLLDIVQTTQANNASHSSSFCLNQEDPQMNLFKGIEVGRPYQDNQHEQELITTSSGIKEIHLPFTCYRNPDAD